MKDDEAARTRRAWVHHWVSRTTLIGMVAGAAAVTGFLWVGVLFHVPFSRDGLTNSRSLLLIAAWAALLYGALRLIPFYQTDKMLREEAQLTVDNRDRQFLTQAQTFTDPEDIQRAWMLYKLQLEDNEATVT